MATHTLPVKEWAQEQFGQCDFGDARRTKRAVLFAAQIASDPSGSTPRQTKGWNECKAAYHLIDCKQVSFAAIGGPHWQRTRAQASGHCLLLGDTTEFDFGVHRQTKGLGPTGDGGGRGFFLHSSLMVSPDSEEIAGLAGQELFYRRERDQTESRHDRILRPRESEVWGRVIDQVGHAPPAARFTHVFDRGADNFEVFAHLTLNHADYVIRAGQLMRKILAPGGERKQLNAHLATLPSLGSYELTVRKQRDQPARTALVEVRASLLLLPAPPHQTPWLRNNGLATIVAWVIEVRELHPPAGVTPLRWVLYTSHAIETFEDAWRVIEYYEKRWLIEEYHKALKTGCQVESRQYETSARLEAITGFLAIAALRLLQLKAVARSKPNCPATDAVPQRWIDVLQALRGHTDETWTVRQFFRELAGLGGFLGRKHDGEPGWQTLWRGLDQLLPAIVYAEALQKCR